MPRTTQKGGGANGPSLRTEEGRGIAALTQHLEIQIEDGSGIVARILTRTPRSAERQLSRCARDLNLFFASQQLRFVARAARSTEVS